MSENKTKTVAELKKWYSDTSQFRENFAAIQQALQLVNLEKTETRSFNTFSKETLRTYLKNPFNNASNLRNLSRYLYRTSHPYRRLIHYNAGMLDLSSRAVIPEYSPIKKNNNNKILKNYYNTLTRLNKLSLESEVYKMAVIAWREDLACGVVYEDETGFFILPFDNDYCRVSSMNYDGTLNWAVDLSYFRTRQEQLEYYGEPFISLYKAYVKDSSLRWQEIPPERSFCIKVNMDDPTFTTCPYMALFSDIIDLCDLQSIQAVKDELSIYKLLVFELETLSGAKNPDEFSVDIDTAIAFYNRVAENLSDQVGAVISPVKITPISFNDDATREINRLADATKNLFNSSGGGQVLNSSSISNGVGWRGAIMTDSQYGLKPLLSQIQKWINRYLDYTLPEHAIVKYLPVTPYTKEDYKASILKDAQYGIPNRLIINTLNGINELDTLSLLHLEQEILNLDSNMHPLQSSHTSSSVTDIDPLSGGRPKNEDRELTDDGISSRDKRANS